MAITTPIPTPPTTKTPITTIPTITIHIGGIGKDTMLAIIQREKRPDLIEHAAYMIAHYRSNAEGKHVKIKGCNEETEAEINEAAENIDQKTKGIISYHGMTTYDEKALSDRRDARNTAKAPISDFEKSCKDKGKIPTSNPSEEVAA